MKILITGGSGLVGRYVVDELCKSHSIEILDLKPSHRTDLHCHTVDIQDLCEVRKVVKGFDAVVHLAGIPHPLNDPPEKVFQVNTVGTFNILEACSIAGIPRFVFMSSESTLGFAFSTTRLTPLYLPLDEDHPLRPQDPYGMSKVAAEMLCRGYSEKSGIKTICLRAPWIWVPEQKERQMYRQLVDDYQKWYKNLWAFIHVNDVAQAISLSIAANLSGKHNSFFVTADNNWTGKASRDLAERWFPETQVFNSAFTGSSSFISSNRAKQELGFRPHHTTADIFAN
jgi:UDP-glucose 4-epimerase